MGLLYLHGQASWKKGVFPSFKKMKGKVHKFLMLLFPCLLPKGCFSFFQDLTISFAEKICFVASWALQNLRAYRVEQWKTYHSPVLILFFCPAFPYPHIFMSLCYRYWQAPPLRAGLPLLSALGSRAEACQAADLVGLCSRRAGWIVRAHTQDISLSPVCSFCFLLGCTHCLPTAPVGIALLLPQLQSVHISLN